MNESQQDGDRLTRIEGQLAEVVQLLRDQKTVKERYTVDEAAERTPYQPYTLRRACREKRIEATKGPDGQWRIPHDVVVMIQNDGLPKASPA